MTPIVKIQREDFDASAELDALTAGRSDIGALTHFTGHVRGEGGITALTLEHYPAMTAAEIARIAGEATSRWPLLGVSIVHRVGRLLPGERIVLVAVASAHRRAAFAACEFLVDYLKTEAPFWKEEERGSQRAWVEAKAGDDAAAARWKIRP